MIHENVDGDLPTIGLKVQGYRQGQPDDQQPETGQNIAVA